MVFDAIGGWNLIRSFRALRNGGRLVAYGFSSVMVGGNRDLKKVISIATGCAAAYAVKLLSRNKRIMIYSIQTLKRQNPEWFRQDLTTLFSLLERGELTPLIDRRLPLEQAAVAQELVSKGETVGKIVLVAQEQVT